MEEIFDHMDDLIGKVLSGEASASEKLEVELWRKESVENEKYFNQLQLVFAKAAAVREHLKFDEEAAWKNVQSKINPSKQIYLQPSTRIPYQIARMAAGIILVSMVGFYAYQWLSNTPVQLAIKADTKIVNDTLPDGSVTIINKKSELAFTFDKKNNTRTVKLKGEAFFDVRHEETKPFVIETDEVIIKDIGTTFNVKAYPNSDTVEVYVESGEVQFYTLKNPGIHLKAGEVGIYNKSIKEFSRIAKLDTNALAYKTKIFSFNNTELQAAVDILNAVYDSKIVLANKGISRCRLTVNFNNDKIEDIADIIAETLGLTASKKEKEWVLDGTGCEPNSQ